MSAATWPLQAHEVTNADASNLWGFVLFFLSVFYLFFSKLNVKVRGWIFNSFFKLYSYNILLKCLLFSLKAYHLACLGLN